MNGDRKEPKDTTSHGSQSLIAIVLYLNSTLVYCYYNMNTDEKML